MSRFALRHYRLIAAAAAVAVLPGIGPAVAAAAPATDDQGYLDSTARCTKPDTAAAFGATESSRVAICKSPSGQYEYRGVRVSDGAKLIAPAARSGGGGFVAEKDGISYKVTAAALVVSAGTQLIRQEPMAEFHELEPAKSPAAAPSPQAEAPATTPTPKAPLPPPLPAEVGGSRH